MIRKYLVPLIGTGKYKPHGPGKELDLPRPKYFGDMNGINYSCPHVGAKGSLFIVICELSEFDHAFVTSHSDVHVIPLDESTLIDHDLLRIFLNSHKMPHAHLNSSITYAEFLEKLNHQFNTIQVMEGIHATFKGKQLDFNTPVSEFHPVLQELLLSPFQPHHSINDILSTISAKWKRGK